MRLVRALFTLAVAVVFLLVGLAFFAHGRPPLGTVYDTAARGPKVSIDDGPHLERAPRFEVLVGKSRKSAHWVSVNVVQYASCSAGEQWNGQLCSSAASRQLGSSPITGRTVALGLIALAMVVTPVAAGLSSGRAHV